MAQFPAYLDLASITTGDGSLGFVLQGERASDISGASVASAGDVNGDGFADLIVGARYADGPADGRNWAGDSYVIFGKAAGFGATLDLASITTGDGSLGFVLQGERAYDWSGRSVASAGDVNGDGFDDLIVGAPHADGPADGRSEAGDSYVIFGKAGGFGATLDLASITTGDGSLGFVLQGERADDRSGWSVASAGDVNGDGFDDLIVGAPDGRDAAGDSYLIFGKAGGFGARLDLGSITTGDGSLGFVLRGERPYDFSGWSVASAGDVNGDGFDDLIVGAPWADGPGDTRGAAGDSYVIFGKAGGFGATLGLGSITKGDGSLGFVLQGERALELSGFSVASAGDVNSDGFDDLIVGARSYFGTSAGESYVIFGTAGGFGATVDLASITTGDGSLGFVLQGEQAGDQSGFSVASAGDVNGDGFDDLIVGAPTADGPADGRSDAGDSYVIFGKAGGFGATLDLASITTGDGSLGFVLQGEQAGDQSGFSVASAGDLNGDGFDDLIVGAPGADVLGVDSGASYVVFGSASMRGPQNWLGTSADELRVGSAFADVLDGAGGDDHLQGIGGDDLLIGGEGNDTLDGGDGNDTLDGGLGDDTAYGGDSKDILLGREGNDVLSGDGGADELLGAEGNDIIDGGSGNDRLFGDAGNDTLYGGLGDDAAYGGDGKDILRGREGNDVLSGGRGADELLGAEGNDIIDGGSGNDLIAGGEGDDSLDGGDGIDTVRYASAGVTVDLALAGVQDTGGAGIDTLQHIENATGSAFGDRLWGSEGANVLSGGEGDDFLVGRKGDDVLDGGAGADRLNGGAGANTLTGGEGNDTFVFDSPLVAGTITTITDLSAGADTVALGSTVFTAVGPVGPLADGRFFIGAAAHDATDRILYNSASGALLYDPDGTGSQAVTQFATVTPGLALTASNFEIF